MEKNITEMELRKRLRETDFKPINELIQEQIETMQEKNKVQKD